MTRMLDNCINNVRSELSLYKLRFNELFDKYFIKKPTILNLLINDVCNSKCVMCNIWKMKIDKEISPEELNQILDDKLFSDLAYVGISGGEPTLRDDLPKLVDVISVKQSVKGLGIITNGIQSKKIIGAIDKCNDICKKHKKRFGVMVSIDGLHGIHDNIRGRKNNFDSALEVISHVRDNGINLTLGCTVVKENVFAVDALLDYCIRNNLYVRFRIGEFINRLYNDDKVESIRNFSYEERYHLALFFFRLEHLYEKNPNVKETYRNIRYMLFEGGTRQSGCPYQTNAVTLDCRGNLIYCSPKSPVLGSCQDTSAISIYKGNISVREKIISSYCSDCIHDYHAPPSYRALKMSREIEKYKITMSLEKLKPFVVGGRSPKPIHGVSANQKILLIGWLGTETAGDKAILDTVINRIKSDYDRPQITVASLYPFVTRNTLWELGLDDISVIHTYSGEYRECCENSSEVVFTGGPLMDMDCLGIVLAAFRYAQASNINTRIIGCGIGPLYGKKYIDAVKEIVVLTDKVSVRDHASKDWIKRNTWRNDIEVTGDPAIEYVKKWLESDGVTEETNSYLGCYVRALPDAYIKYRSDIDKQTMKERYEQGIANIIRYISEKTGMAPFYVPMHTFSIGEDDRIFIRKLIEKYLYDINYYYQDMHYKPQEILKIMKACRVNLCVRFHSIVFADTLGSDFVAIDYTDGGKNQSYINERGKNNQLIMFDQLMEGNWKAIIDNNIVNAVSREVSSGK